MGVNFDDGPLRGRGYITPAMKFPKVGYVVPETDEQQAMRELEQQVAGLMGANPDRVADAVKALLASPLGCDHVATVTAHLHYTHGQSSWVSERPVTVCVTCRAILGEEP